MDICYLLNVDVADSKRIMVDYLSREVNNKINFMYEILH